MCRKDRNQLLMSCSCTFHFDRKSEVDDDDTATRESRDASCTTEAPDFDPL